MIETEIINKLPMHYKETLNNVINIAIKIFNDNLINLTLGGSAGKGNVIDNWSDLDLYIILYSYDIEQVKYFMKNISSFEIHIGTTFYTIHEIKNNLIDGKTKSMLYEKQNFNVNPILYGSDIFNLISYNIVQENDINNFPNILHDFRRRFIELCNGKDLDKIYIKKMTVLIKCYLSYYNIFSYGYKETIEKLYKVLDLTSSFDFDIIYVIHNMNKSKNIVILFSKFLLEIIENDTIGGIKMEKRISSRAIIFYEDSLLTMFRRKIKDDGSIKEYYVIPGGGLENNESLEENVKRELNEEFNVEINILGYLGKIENENSIEHYFHCEIVNGTPHLGGEELDRMTEKNYYEIRKIKIDDIKNIDINAKDKIENAINHIYEEK